MWGNRTEPADLQIHLEIPCRVAMPWASFNVAVVNPEWWVLHAWDWCFLPPAQGGFDRIVFKSQTATALFPEVKKSQRLIMNWWTDMTVRHGVYKGKEERFLYIVGGSKSKEAAASILVGAWDRTWPPLEIWCPSVTAERLNPFIRNGATVFFQTEYKTKEEKEERQRRKEEQQRHQIEEEQRRLLEQQLHSTKQVLEGSGSDNSTKSEQIATLQQQLAQAATELEEQKRRGKTEKAATQATMLALREELAVLKAQRSNTPSESDVSITSERPSHRSRGSSKESRSAKPQLTDRTDKTDKTDSR
jgi:hypothetical protein